MRIKNLNVVGFKSFLEKTSFSFDVPITSIVGPNGCGKSNVVDALKWVTGELSYKELRGKSMEDLIFAGSELRPPTSMMEVALTLENDRGLAPSQYNDFSEITVTRRIFRDGSSEFYINKTECRLKDILDLFLDTGIGMSSYSIIEQGRVGAIVSGRPEDRRLVIEEAAGITKFKNRKQAAQRKMDATRQNLLRVTDIILELKRQIGSLERQAQKAEKFKVMREEAKSLDLSLLSREYVLGREKLDELARQEQTVLQSTQSDESKFQEKDNQYETLKLELLEKEQALEKTQQALFEKKSGIQEIESHIHSDSREVEFLEKQISENSARVNSLEMNSKEWNEKQKTLTTELAQFKVDLSNLEALLTDGIKSHDISSLNLKEVEKELENEKSHYLKVATDEATLSEQTQSYQNRMTELEQSIENIEIQIEKEKVTYAELENSVKTKKAVLTEVSQLKFNFESDETALTSSIEALKVEKQSLGVALSEVNQKLEGLRSRLNTLEEFIQNYQGYRKGVRVVMEQKASDASILALIGEVVHPERGYERAVQAALAELIECILVDQRKDASRMIQYLKDQKCGRGTFVPKVITFSSHEIDLRHLDGVKGWLTDFVRIDDDYASFVRGLLSSTLLVESLDHAISIWETGTHVNMVTPSGDRISEKGFISGGDWSEETGVLEIHNQADEIRSKVSEIERDKSDIEEKVEINQKALVLKEEDLKTIQGHLDRELKRSSEIEREIIRLEEEFKTSASKNSSLQQAFDKFMSEKGTLHTKLLEATESLGRLVEAKQISEEHQKEFLGQIHRVRETVTHQHQVATDMKVQKASLQERIDSFEREQENLAKRVEDAEVEIRTLLENIQVSRSSIVSKKASIDQFQQKKVELIEAFQILEQAFQEERSIYDVKLADLSMLEEALRELQKQKDSWTQEVNKVRMLLQEQRLRLEHLEVQTKERYEMDISEYIEKEDFVLLDEDGLERVSSLLVTLKEKMAKIGDVNLAAIGELEELRERFEFLTAQKDDLEKSLDDLVLAIKKINSTTKDMFVQTFDAVNTKFQNLFPHLFRGGKAKLVLTEPENILETGVEIVAQPPGKKLQNMNLLSGGEKALTAIALLFAIFEFKAPPVCVLDEVDAPLDDVNVGRFIEVVRSMSQKTQFIVITHNKNTMEVADNLYGVTMEEPGVSRIVSVRVQKVVEQALQTPSEDIVAVG
ncbi:MAG: chromosome segregation protein SMC [Bdellovibrionales bacterium]|nr:chromosome segregation protein SMC [Bdellovibrionales bacterium]